MDPSQPVPVAPTPAPVPDTGGPTPLSQDQMKANLRDMMSKIESKYQDFNTQKFSLGNQSQEMQSQALRQLFDLFKSVGVDPTKPEEVKAFLDKVRQSNPELSQQIESALNGLLGADSPGQSMNVGEIPSSGGANMNINTNATPQQIV